MPAQNFIASCSSKLPKDIDNASPVQSNALRQRQQDAGEFLHHLLDQFSQVRRAIIRRIWILSSICELLSKR